jgi:hypothetical protein
MDRGRGQERLEVRDPARASRGAEQGGGARLGASDRHYVEQSRKRGRSLAAADGPVITVEGNDVVRSRPDGRRFVLQASDGREIVVDGKLLVSPLGTSQRRRGRPRHPPPEHGDRLRNEDIAKL